MEVPVFSGLRGGRQTVNDSGNSIGAFEFLAVVPGGSGARVAGRSGCRGKQPTTSATLVRRFGQAGREVVPLRGGDADVSKRFGDDGVVCRPVLRSVALRPRMEWLTTSGTPAARQSWPTRRARAPGRGRAGGEEPFTRSVSRGRPLWQVTPSQPVLHARAVCADEDVEPT
jgi:hypothetical protein